MVCMMEEYFLILVDYVFIVQMEDYFDMISCNEVEYLVYFEEFYFGEDNVGLKICFDVKLVDVNVCEISMFFIGFLEFE